MVKFSLDELRQCRSYSQGLTKRFTSVATAIQHLGGLQSQELPSAALALRARTTNLTIDDVKSARENERSIVLTWAMRGTMHLVHADDFVWLNQLYGSEYIRLGQRRFKELNLSAPTLEKAANLIQQFLQQNGAMTRPELAQALAKHAIPVEGQAIAHMVRYAALLGLICFGAEQDGELTYVLRADWLKNKPFQPEYPEAELLSRYLAAYAPATLQDFVTWSGLSTPQAKAAFSSLADEMEEVECEGLKLWMLKKQSQDFSESLALLPRYDNYWLGYQKRDLLVDERFAKAIHPGGGLIHPALAINGAGKGAWQFDAKRRKLILHPFETLGDEFASRLEAEVADMGRFLHEKFSLLLAKP